MFDLDGNGVVDADEFDKVTEIIMKGTTVAKQHKTKKRQSNISRYFFGESEWLNLILPSLEQVNSGIGKTVV